VAWLVTTLLGVIIPAWLILSPGLIFPSGFILPPWFMLSPGFILPPWFILPPCVVVSFAFVIPSGLVLPAAVFGGTRYAFEAVENFVFDSRQVRVVLGLK
jgi:hypothetical protein